MNDNLLEIIKKIVTEQGESILSEPRRISAMFADIAQDVPKPQKNAFLKCLEHKFAQVLKNIAESERVNCKQQLAQILHEEEGLDLGLCGETLDILEAVLFGKSPAAPQKQAPAPKPSSASKKPAAKPAVSKSAVKNQTAKPAAKKPAAPTPSSAPVNPPAPVKIKTKCDGCFYANNNSMMCNYYNMPIHEVVKFKCYYDDSLRSQTQTPSQTSQTASSRPEPPIVQPMSQQTEPPKKTNPFMTILFILFFLYLIDSFFNNGKILNSLISMIMNLF